MLNSKLNNNFQMLVNRMLYKLLRTCTKFLLNNKNKLFLICISNLFIVACIPAQGVNGAQSIAIHVRSPVDPSNNKSRTHFPKRNRKFLCTCTISKFNTRLPNRSLPLVFNQGVRLKGSLVTKKITTSTNTTRKLFWGERQHPSIHSLRDYLFCN